MGKTNENGIQSTEIRLLPSIVFRVHFLKKFPLPTVHFPTRSSTSVRHRSLHGFCLKTRFVKSAFTLLGCGGRSGRGVCHRRGGRGRAGRRRRHRRRVLVRVADRRRHGRAGRRAQRQHASQTRRVHRVQRVHRVAAQRGRVRRLAGAVHRVDARRRRPHRLLLLPAIVSLLSSFFLLHKAQPEPPKRLPSTCR